MSDITTLHSMIHHNAKIPIVNHYKKAYVILKDADSPESVVQINGLPQDAVVIKIDYSADN